LRQINIKIHDHGRMTGVPRVNSRGSFPMTYATLMVHCDLDPGPDNRLNIAADLAAQFDARVIGIAAQPEIVPLYFADGYAPANILEEEDRVSIERRLQTAEGRFRDAMKGRVGKVEWRAAIDEPLSFIARESRAADLVIVGTNPEYIVVDPGDLVMLAGRPLLMVPAETDVLRAERILIAWKDTRESRRAVFDALPLLRLCQKAIVAEIDEDKEPDLANRRVEDVVSWLQCHGVNAAGWSEPVREAAAAQLESLAAEEAADLVVAGAYGHGRIREWVFGGATQDFLRQSSRCHLLSH
jgi:nucleotide-binding universal stress UspA family protein